MSVHQAPDRRRHHGRHQKPERKNAGGHAAVPAEIAKDRREQQGKGGAGVDTHRHRQKPDRDHHPTIEKRHPPLAAHHTTRLSGGSPLAMRAMFSAISLARASSVPSVAPETCGVISTFGSSWNGRVAGAVAPGSRG